MTRQKKAFILMGLIVLLFSSAIRLYRLDMIPLNLDEKFDTIDRIKHVEEIGNKGLFNALSVKNIETVPILFNFFALIASYFFNDPVFIARIPAVIFGVLGVLFTLILSRRFYGEKTGLLSALFLACLPWHIIQSRIGLGIITGPFFCLALLYLLDKGMVDKNRFLIILSFLMLGISIFYTYHSAIIILPIFIAAFLVLGKDNARYDLKVIFLGVFILFVLLVPWLIIATRTDLIKLLYPNVSILNKNILLNIKNIIQVLFFSGFPPESLFAPSMRQPLLLGKFYLLIFASSAIYAVLKKTKGDIILLIWLFTSIAAVTLSINNEISPRYLFIMLPAPMILTARFLISIFDYPAGAKNLLLKTAVIIISLLIIGASLKTAASYFSDAPKSKAEWIINSFGSKEAAKFLVSDNTSKKYKVCTDFRMTILPYLKYYIGVFKGKEEIFGGCESNFIQNDGGNLIVKDDIVRFEKDFVEKGTVIYYFIWSPKSHTGNNEWEKLFTAAYDAFKLVHPGSVPVKEIYYPDGTVAIEVFKVYT